MANWISYSPQSGCNSGQITITAATYSELQDRLATIMAYNTGEGLTATTDIVQFSLPPTSITLNSISIRLLRDVSAFGGTVTEQDCEYEVIGYFSDGTEKDITNLAVVSGSLTVPLSLEEERHSVGYLLLTATYSGYTSTGETEVFQEAFIAPTADTRDYFAIQALEDGVLTVSVNLDYQFPDSSYMYKINNSEWVSVSGYQQIQVEAGDVVKFKSNGDVTYPYRRSFNFDSDFLYNVYGNTMSLCHEDFEDDINYQTYNGWSSIYFNPNSSGSPVLADNLILPVVFDNSSSHPTFKNMFNGCRSLVKAPKLPATTLSNNCYEQMFINCTNLEVAPDLPASYIPKEAYRNMFNGCSKLNYVKCLAEDGDWQTCTLGWLQGVSSTGTFIKHPEITWPVDGGYRYIPSGWTIIDADI